MNKKTVSVEIRLEDFISQNLDQIKSQVKDFDRGVEQHSQRITGLEGSFKSLARTLGGVAIAYKALRFGKDSIELYKVQAEAVAQLDSALGRSSKSLQNFASELQGVTTFGDEAIIAAQARIASFIKEESEIRRVTEAAIDMAAATGMDLASASDLLTRSIVSSTNALGRYGLQIDGAAGSEERLRSAVEAVNVAYGGRARDLAQTDVGKLQQQANILGDIQEEIGQKIIPAQLAWNEALLGMVNLLNRGLSAYQNMFDVLGRVAGGERFGDAVENIRLARALDKAAEMDRTEAASYLFDVRAGYLSEIEKKEQELATLRQTHLNLQLSGNTRVADRRMQDIQREEAALVQLRERSEAVRRAMVGYTGPEATGGGMGAGTGETTVDDAAIRAAQRRAEEVARLKQREIETRIQLEHDGQEQEKQLLEARHLREIEQYADNKEALRVLDEIHISERLALDHKYYEVRAAEEKLKEDERYRLVMDAERMLQDSRIELIEDVYERELERLRLKHDEELELYRQTGADTVAIKEAHENQITALEERHSQRRQQIAQQEAMNRIRAFSMVSSSFGQTLGLMGAASRENAEQQKTIAKIQARINTFEAASRANSATPYPPVNALLMAAAITQGMVQVRNIEAQKFQHGGIVQGPRNPVDSVPVRARGGEMFLNEQQQANLFNMINRGGGNSQPVTVNLYDRQGALTDQLTAELRDGSGQRLLDEIKRMAG